MAERAVFHLERKIPEFDQMRRLKLFEPKEIDEIIKRRTEYEYRIERTKKEKKDFSAYIEYEVKLIKEIRLRRDKYKIKEKKDEIEYSIMKRVTKLYKLALSYFKADTKLWLAYINFCVQTRFVNSVSEALKQMLQVHGDKAHLWRYAAKCELEEMKNIEGALNFLKTGLHHHPHSRELYTDAFRSELFAGSQKDKTVIDVEEERCRHEKAITRAEVHFKTSVKAVGDDVEFIIGLLDTATEFDFTEDLQKAIIEYLTTKCWRSELMWHTMAQRELQGRHYDKNVGGENKSRIQLCVSVYKSATKVLPTACMWEKFLDTLLELYHDKKKKTILKDVLMESLQDGCNAGFLNEKHFLVWQEMFEDPQKQLEVLEKATSALPGSVKLWVKRLQHHISEDDEEQVKKVSTEAKKALKKDALPIYKTLIQYHTAKQTSFLELKALFEEGITRDPEISLELRPMYIEWFFLVKNIKLARMEYEKIARYTPFSVELHKKMIELEIGRIEPLCVNAIRNVHNLALQQFGQNRTDVWIEYIKFEKVHNARAVSDIYNRAINTLSSNLVGAFVAEFTLLNTCPS